MFLFNFSENPAFDNSYDTFQNGEENIEMSHPTSPSRGTQGSIQTGSVDPNNEINVSVAEPNRVNVGPAIPHEDYEDGVEDITADILAESLPSTQMRKLRGLARPGKSALCF